MNRILVVGSGSWGTALVQILLENKSLFVDWWVRDDKMAQKINTKGQNPRYLRSVRLDTNRLKASSNIEQLISDNDCILLVTPSAFIADLLKDISSDQLNCKKIISAIKGVEPNSLKIVGEYLFEYKGVKESDFGVITGPCHAEEVAQEKLSYLTFASTNEKFVDEICSLISCEYISVLPSADIYGTEIAAVLKNVYSIACGICHSLGYGDNFQAVW